jgi:hypothetical protein
MQHEMNNLGLGSFTTPVTHDRALFNTRSNMETFRAHQDRLRIRFAGILTILFLLALHVIRAIC